MLKFIGAFADSLKSAFQKKQEHINLMSREDVDHIRRAVLRATPLITVHSLPLENTSLRRNVGFITPEEHGPEDVRKAEEAFITAAAERGRPMTRQNIPRYFRGDLNTPYLPAMTPNLVAPPNIKANHPNPNPQN